MSSDFVDKKGKPTGKEYLSASLEDVIDRANKSSSESEIPFITALFTAKSHENQKKTSNKMFYVAIATTFIAVLSLAQSYYLSTRSTTTAQELIAVRDKASDQDKRIIELQTKVASIESMAQSLRIQKEEYLRIIKNLAKVIPQHNHTDSDKKHNKSMQPTADAAAD